MSDETGANRREHERIEARVRVKLKFDNVKNLRQFYTKDISQGGLFIVTEKPKPIGTHVEIVIYPPGVPLGFPIQGTVVHIVDAATAKGRGTAPGMGVRFSDLTPDKVSSIKAYVDSMGDIEREETVAVKSPLAAAEASKPTLPAEPADAGGAAAAPAGAEADTRPVELMLENRDQLKKLYVQDLSKGTLFLRTPEVRPAGSALSLHLLVAGMEKGMWLSATVVRVVVSVEKGKDMSGMGLELTDFSDEKRKAIDEYLKGRAADIAIEGDEGPAEEAPGETEAQGGGEPEPVSDDQLVGAGAAPDADAGGAEDTVVAGPAAIAAARAAAAKGKPGAPLPSIAELDKDKKDKRPPITNVEQLETAMKDFENASVSKNYFDQLGLPTNALLDEIKTVYFQLVRRFHPDPWQGKASADVVGRLDKLQMHLRTIYDTLSHPQKRAAYEVSNGIEAEGGDAILEQAREKKRSEYRAAFARKFGDHISKGEKLIDAAMEDIRAGKTKSALSNIRLALSFDPLNEKYRKLLKTVLDKGGSKGPGGAPSP